MRETLSEIIARPFLNTFHQGMTYLKKKKTKRKIKKQEIQRDFLLPEQDETYYFIVDYTDWGFPYGITWEEYYDNITDFEQEYYYISEISEGRIIGLTWKEFLKELDKDFLGELEDGDYIR
jgi:hypothetical protein